MNELPDCGRAPTLVVPQLCYLCGMPLTEPITPDHVPPKQLYAPDVRRVRGPNLLTIPVHDACNKFYQRDEDYFVQSLVPFARGSYAGNAIYKWMLESYRKGNNAGLVRKVLAEFEPRPSGLILPGNKVVKRFAGDRIARVAWKIVRGLYFHHHQEVLPVDLVTWIAVIPPDQIPPKHFLYFANLPDNKPHGIYPGVFDYRFQKFSVEHYWALLLWDRIIVTVIFHDPTCRYDKCQRPAVNP